MPYPNSNVLNIVIPQTSASKDGTQAPFVERIISGSNLILQTDTTGTLIGSFDLNANNITASNISASNNISASTLRVETSIVDGGTLTVLGNTVLGDAITDTTRITGSASISGSLTVVGPTTLQSTFVTNLTASNISASGTIIATDISASNEMLIGSGPIYRTWTERNLNQDHTKLYVSGSATIFGNYATLTLATSASDAGAQSNIIFSRLGAYSPPGDPTPVLLGRMSLGIDSGSNDLRVFGYYASTDPENNAFSNINAGTRVIFKQNGYFGIGSFISYGQYGGSVIDYKSSLPGYAGQNYVGPDALLTLLPADSGSVGTAASRFANRNILNIMSYDTSSIMFISGSDGYVLLGKNTTDGINRLQVAGNVSASAYTGSSANFTSLIATNITSSNISASGNISASTLTVVGNSILSNVFATNVTASNISASGQIIASSFTGSLLGTSSWANVSLSSSVDKINDNSTYYVTFVNNTGSSALKTDSDILSYNPLLNRVTVGNTSGSLFISNDTGTNPNSIALYNSNDNSGATVQVGLPASNETASLYVGKNTNGFRVLTGQGNNTGVVTELTTNITNTTNATTYTDTTAALRVDGGARISKDTYISGSLNVAGDFTVFGSSSVVYISSSTVIINDNIIQLNAFFPYERYAGFEVFDSGSNQRSASLLWDGQNDNWITVDQNNSSSNVIVGPTASFGTNPGSLTANNIPKAYDATGITTSSLSDDGTTLRYTGNVISSSSITASYGTVTYITGALVTYVTGSFNVLQVSTGSSPGTGQVPSTPGANGFVGQITVDNNFIYVYTGNIWKRVPIANWAP